MMSKHWRPSRTHSSRRRTTRSRPEVAKTGAYVGGNPLANDWYLGDPLEVGFTEHAKTIPVMVGTVLGEFSFMPALSEEEKADAALIDSMIEKRYGAEGKKLKEMFAKVYPDKDVSDVLFMDSIFPCARLPISS